MQKGKTWQRVASAVLAVMMTMSTFSSTIAYAAEPITADSSLVTDAVSESTATETVEALDSASSSSSEEEITEPVGTPVPTEMPDETDSSEPEATPEPTEVPTSTPEPTETPDATATPEPTEAPEATETPDVDESDFVAVSLADDATEGQVEAEIGDEVTFNTLAKGKETASMIHDNKWLPADFWRPDGFTDQQCAQKHTTITLTLHAADYNWSGYYFRIVASYRFNEKRTKVENSYSAIGDADNLPYDAACAGQERKHHLWTWLQEYQTSVCRRCLLLE